MDLRTSYYTTLYEKGQQPQGKNLLFARGGEDSGGCKQGGADRHGGGAGRIAVGGGPCGVPGEPWGRKESGMKEVLTNRLARLLCVKSLVTLILTAVFAVMALTGEISRDFLTVYTIIIAFYFGTQMEQKNQSEVSGS